MGTNIEIIGGPTPIPVLRLPGHIYRWKVQNGTAEQHVYVQIADALRPESVDEPLRSGIATKGETVLRALLQDGNVPTRIKITSGGITEVGMDRRARPCVLSAPRSELRVHAGRGTARGPEGLLPPRRALPPTG